MCQRIEARTCASDSVIRAIRAATSRLVHVGDRVVMQVNPRDLDIGIAASGQRRKTRSRSSALPRQASSAASETLSLRSGDRSRRCN